MCRMMGRAESILEQYRHFHKLRDEMWRSCVLVVKEGYFVEPPLVDQLEELALQ